MRLGKLAPKRDSRNLRLAKYLATSDLPNPPKNNVLSKAVGAWGMMLNDRLGDCTCAAIGHQLQCWTAWSKGSQFTPADESVRALYDRVNGGADNGAMMVDVLNEFRNNGLSGHKFLAYAAVDWTNRREMEVAAWLSGGLYLGFQLPKSAQGQRRWVVGGVGDTLPGSWGGHAVYMPDYAAYACNQEYRVVTWGEMCPVSVPFMERYCDEAYALVSEDWINNSGRAPNGFDLETLKADLGKI
jgi:hypothetical protein